MKVLLPLLILFTCISCNQNSSKEKDNVIQSQEEKIKALEDRLNKVEETSNKTGVRDSVDYTQNYIPPPQPKKEYYSIGSLESEVLDIQGDPSSIYDLGGDKVFMYGSSMVTFRNKKVISYSNIDNNLKIRVSSKVPSTSNQSNTQTVTPKGKTKYVYYTCYIKEFDEMTKYISKIYTIENFTDEKMWRIGDCLVEQVRFFKRTRDKISALPDLFDSYSEASSQWNNKSGSSMPGENFCNSK